MSIHGQSAGARTSHYQADYVNAGTQATGNPERLSFDNINVMDRYEALEIDPESDIDCCGIDIDGTQYFLGVGAPVIGCFRGPARIRQIHDAPSAFDATSLANGIANPRLKIRVYENHQFAGYVTRRTNKNLRSLLIPIANNPNIFTTGIEIPFYGRSRMTMAILGGSGTITYRVDNRYYDGPGVNTFQAFTVVAATALLTGVVGAQRVYSEEADTVAIMLQAGVVNQTASIRVRVYDV